MALVLKNIYETFNYFFTEYRDPRVEHYPLLGSPLPIVAVIIIYLKFVKVWGPEMMKNRKPFQLTTLMNVYNIIQIFLNLYIGIVGGLNSYFSADYSWSCEPINQKGGSSRKKLIFVTYLYFISKIIDLLDTVFFVVRKKNNQITFLHTYHHAGMVVATYVFTKFLAGSHATLLGLINSFVHVIMYFYYFLTSFKPELKNSLWWKKHITQVQLLQFTILMVHFGVPLIGGYCEFPKVFLFIGLTQNMFMFALFADFYIKTYIKKNNSSAIKQASNKAMMNCTDVK